MSPEERISPENPGAREEETGADGVACPEELLLPGERLDDLQRDGYRIIQNGKLFCFGMDAVLLAAFARVKAGERALDLGTGTGVIPILLEARTRGAAFAGLEICKASADMAARSVRLNRRRTRSPLFRGTSKRPTGFFRRLLLTW